MKKHRIKNYLKLGFLLFGVSLLVVNCQKDDSEAIDEPVVKKSPFQVNQVSIEEIPRVGNVLQRPGTASSNRTADLSCGTINLDDILQVTHLEEGKTNYSFHFLHESDQDGSVFYNYLITENDDDTYGEFILEYIPDETFLSQYSIYSPEGIENFSGQLNLYSYADFCGSPSQRTASSTPLPPCASTGVGSGGSAGLDNSDNIDDESGGNGSGGGGGSICNAILSTHLSCGYANPPHYSSCYTTVISGWECHAVSRSSSAKTKQDCPSIDFAGIAPTSYPCKDIRTQITNPDFITKVDVVNSSSAFNASQETGFSQNSDGSFNELSATNGGHSLSIPITNSMIGYLHTHLNSTEIPDQNGDGIPDESIPIKMPSPGDIITFLELLENANSNGIALSKVYGSMYSSASNYTLKFTGNISDVLSNLSNLRLLRNNKTLKKKYTEYFEKYKFNKEKALLHFMKNEIGVNGVRLFKIKNNGTIKEKKLNENGNVETETCP